MAEIVRMPKLSDTMTEGVIAKWHKKVGDKVKSGEQLSKDEITLAGAIKSVQVLGMTEEERL